MFSPYLFPIFVSGTTPKSTNPIVSSISSALLTLSSSNSNNTIPATAKINPNAVAKIAFLGMFGELGEVAAFASSNVVTSSIFVTSLIWSAEISFTVFAKSLATCGSLS